jgi:hypothetical protein
MYSEGEGPTDDLVDIWFKNLFDLLIVLVGYYIDV